MRVAHQFKFLTALVVSLALASCANQMQPAQQSITDIEAAIVAAGPDAEVYAADELGAVNMKLADLKASFERKEYKAILDAAPALLTEAQGLAAVAAARKQEAMDVLTAQWTALSAELPQRVAAIEAQLGTLAEARKLPDGMTKDTLAAATAALDDAKRMWTDASAAFGAGELQSAVDTAIAVKAKTDELMTALGITTG